MQAEVGKDDLWYGYFDGFLGGEKVDGMIQTTTVHSVTKETPGAFIYQRDMLLPIQSFTDWELVHQKKPTTSPRIYSRRTKLVVPLIGNQEWKY
jgi:hypothetical protein